MGISGSVKKNSVAWGALLLALSAFIAKFIGALYRIPLTNVLGAEGMGVYQLVFPIYALLLTISTSAVPIVISRLIAECANYKDKVKIFTTAKILLLVSSIAGFILLVAFASLISKLQGVQASKYGYYAIAPSILFASGIAGFRGYFQGNLKMLPSAISGLLEQVVKLVFGLVFSIYLIKYGVIYGVVGAILGVTIAEFATLMYLWACYVLRKEKLKTNIAQDFKVNSKKILTIATPILLGGLIFPVTQVIDSVLIVNVMRLTGKGLSYSTAMYGLLTGPVNSLINMPVVLIISLSIVIIPSISKKRVAHNLDGIKNGSLFALKVCLLISLPFAVLFIIYAKPIITLLYPRLASYEIAKTIFLLQLSSVNIIFLAFMQIFAALLQAVDKAKATVKATLIGGGCKIVLNVVLLLFMDIEGVAVSSAISFGITMLLNYIYYKKVIGTSKIEFAFYLKIALTLMLTATVSLLVYYFAGKGMLGFFVGSFVGLIIYCFTILQLNVLSRGEILSLPLGGKIIKLKFNFKKSNKQV